MAILQSTIQFKDKMQFVAGLRQVATHIPKLEREIMTLQKQISSISVSAARLPLQEFMDESQSQARVSNLSSGIRGQAKAETRWTSHEQYYSSRTFFEWSHCGSKIF